MSTFDIGKVLRANLVAQRELRGLTQSQLGARAGIAPAAVSHFETGQRMPSLDSLLKLAVALDCSIDVLLGRVPAESGVQIDPIFIRASRADSNTLDTLRRITATLLDGAESQRS